jgi:hypothetical protein
MDIFMQLGFNEHDMFESSKVTSSQSYKNFTSEIYENSAAFLQVFKIQSYKAFFTSEFFWWILQVNFSLKNSLEKI